MSDNEKFSILVVDDERTNIDALSYILKPEYKVLVAKDGQTALEIAKSKIPHLILLDIVMPGMNGFDVLTELKSSGITHNIPVIFITGRDNAEDEGRGLSLGAVDYIAKPFHNFIVEARVKTHIQMVKYIQMIERLCMIDALTNLPNRRYFDKQLKTEWERAYRNKKPVSMLMIDIDKFKIYNDTYGHLQGDVLLKAIAVSFKKTLHRSADFVARWGGEEFSALFPEIDLKKAIEIAERIRADIENMVVPLSDEINTKVTVSIGVNCEIPSAGNKSEMLISGADKALYAAKTAGRNKVMHIGKII